MARGFDRIGRARPCAVGKRGRVRGRASQERDLQAGGNHGLQVDRPLSVRQSSPASDQERDGKLNTERRSGSRSPSISGVAGVRSDRSVSIFDGYPAEVIAQWCGVSVATACAWKRGAAKPGRPALRLFTLFREGKVLGAEWRRCVIRGDRLYDQAGKSLSVAQIEHYELLLQWAAHLTNDNPRYRAEYDELLRLLEVGT